MHIAYTSWRVALRGRREHATCTVTNAYPWECLQVGMCKTVVQACGSIERVLCHVSSVSQREARSESCAIILRLIVEKKTCLPTQRVAGEVQAPESHHAARAESSCQEWLMFQPLIVTHLVATYSLYCSLSGHVPCCDQPGGSKERWRGTIRIITPTIIKLLRARCRRKQRW